MVVDDHVHALVEGAHPSRRVEGGGGPAMAREAGAQRVEGGASPRELDGDELVLAERGGDQLRAPRVGHVRRSDARVHAVLWEREQRRAWLGLGLG